MAKRPPSGSDGPDLFEALKGVAHLGDMARQAMGKKDPQLRDQVEMLGNANMKQVLSAAGDAINSETPEPHMDLRDTSYGLDVLVDTSNTPVNPTNITTFYEDQEVTLMEPQSGWEATASTKSEVDHVDVDASESNVATVQVYFAGDRDDFDSPNADVDEDESSDTDPSPDSPSDSNVSTLDMTATDSPLDDDLASDSLNAALEELDEDMTLNEALQENPALAKVAKDAVGEDMVASAQMMFGDTPLADIPLDRVLPEEYADALDDVPSDDSEGFEFDSDPLSQDDDE